MPAQVVKLVDTSVLGTDAARREGSSPFLGTMKKSLRNKGFFLTPNLMLELT